VNHSSFYRRRHLDSHHKDSCDFLHQIGFSIDDTSARGSGRQDVCVGAGGVDFRLEFKTGDGPSTPAQVKFHREWRGRKIEILRSLEETKEWGLRTLHELTRASDPKMLASKGAAA
jgi:hypothetical protein